MASRYEEQQEYSCTECENCGATDGLLRCSRCHAAWFCSLKCHKAYWPFHKSACRRNDFADAIEHQEPQFAAWMRKHGKLAVLQDDEVDRLERSSRPGGWLGLGRQEVMEAMYGRADPRPTAPTYHMTATAAATQQQQQQQQSGAAVVPVSSTDRGWQEITIPEGLGLAATRFKWRQNLSHVEVFVRLPGSVQPKQVCVQLSPSSLAVSAAGDALLAGQLAAAIKLEHSTWYCDEGILYMQLLKRNRRGHYSNGATAADTFWFSLLAAAKGADRLPGPHPPTRYYSSAYEADDLAPL
ncbi:hypothetical protein OEZ86_007821 [Tetradesmus obliquus]|nr:hypothetical protein OEZ86_007821 [Tetradesmus obliquus]